MVRQCHSNTCPVGVCTQDEKLREKFSGTPDKVVNLFTFIASEVREILAELGFKSLNDIIGRTDLLMQVNKASPNLDDLDLNPLFVQADPGNNKRYCENQEINQVPKTLDQEIWPDIEKSLDNSLKAPTSSNLQTWEIYWVKSKDIKNKVVEACLSQPAAKTARELFVFVSRPDYWKRNNQMMLDLSLIHI